MKSEQEHILEAARQAAVSAYAPYSGLKVGAALLADGGELHTGGNQENVSYGLSICAERAALASALSAGLRRFSAIAIVAVDEAGKERDAPPCGACRQALFEFSGEMAVTYRIRGRMVTASLADLLPDAFEKGGRSGG